MQNNIIPFPSHRITLGSEIYVKRPDVVGRRPASATSHTFQALKESSYIEINHHAQLGLVPDIVLQRLVSVLNRPLTHDIYSVVKATNAANYTHSMIIKELADDKGRKGWIRT